MAAHYYLDYIEPANNYRMRLFWVIPGTFPTGALDDPPAWGLGTSWAGAWSPLPDNCVTPPSLGDVAFNGNVPVGAPKTPLARVRFDLVELHLRGFDEMVTVLKSPAVAGGVSFAIPGGSSHTMIADTVPVLTVLTDNGDAELDIEDFAVAFQGCQIKQAQRPIALDYTNDLAIYEATYAHIIEACLERIKPVDIAQYALYNFNITTSRWTGEAGGSGAYAFAHLYDAIYQGGVDNATYGIGSATRASDIVEQFRCRLFAVETLPRTVELLALEVYKTMLRDTTASFAFRRSTGTLAYVGEATPFDFLRFATQTYLGTGARGSELQINGPGVKEIFFIGAGWRGGDTTYAVDDPALGEAFDNDEIDFGMFSPHDTEFGVYSYTNAYDLFVDMCEGGLSKATYQFAEAAGLMPWLNCAVYFSPILGGYTAIRDIHREDTFNEDPNAVLGAAYVAEVEVQWPDPQGDDEGVIVRAKTEGNLGENKGGANLFFHNIPLQGSESDFKWWNGNSPGQPNIVDDTRVFMSYPIFSCRRLYYFDDAGGLLDGDSPILVHNQLRLEKNWSTFTDWAGTTQDSPTPPLRGSVTLPFAQSYQDYYTEQLIRPYRARVLALQRESCLGYFASDFLQRMFGSEGQWGITVKLDMNKANVTYVGERFQLVDDNDDPASLDIFVRNGAFLDATHYPSLAYCVAAAEEDGFIKLSLLGIAAT